MKPVLPAEAWRLIQEMAEGRHSGQVVLNFNQGRCESGSLQRHERFTRPTLPLASSGASA